MPDSIPKDIIDWPLTLEKLNGNATLAKEVLGMFLKELPEQQQLINDACQSRQLEDMYGHLHKLHGSCCYVGVPQLQQSVKILMITAKNKNTAELEQQLAEFNQQAQAVQKAGKTLPHVIT